MIPLSDNKCSKNDWNHYSLVRKKKPAYFSALRRLSKTSLIFIAVDRTSWLMIRHFNYPCLLCQEDAAVYDLGFCYQRDVWVLYADNIHFISAMQLAYTAQRSGAAYVCAILVDNHWTKEQLDV